MILQITTCLYTRFIVVDFKISKHTFKNKALSLIYYFTKINMSVILSNGIFRFHKTVLVINYLILAEDVNGFGILFDHKINNVGRRSLSKSFNKSCI